MKVFFDFLPLLLFFAALRWGDIFVATAVVIAASLLQVGVLVLLKRRVDTMLWVSLGTVVVFGGATLLLHDKTFVMWKPTVLYWLFAVALAGSLLLFRKNLIRSMLSEHVEVPAPIWTRLNWAWVAFFSLMGIANYLVAFVVSPEYCADIPAPAERERCIENAWGTFKVFGATGLMFVFVLAQALYLARHMPKDGTTEAS